MTKRATVTKPEAARIIRAAKEAGAVEVEIRPRDEVAYIVRLVPSTEPEKALASDQEIVL